MKSEDNNKKPVPDHIQRLREERDEYEKERCVTSCAGGEGAGDDWAREAHYVELRDFIEANKEIDWAYLKLPEDVSWDDHMDIDDEAFTQGFYEAAAAVFLQVQSG